MAMQLKGHCQWRQMRDHSQWKQALPHYKSYYPGRCQCLCSNCWGVKGQVWAEGRIKARWETLIVQLCVWGLCLLSYGLCSQHRAQSKTEHLMQKTTEAVNTWCTACTWCFCTWTHISDSCSTPNLWDSFVWKCLLLKAEHLFSVMLLDTKIYITHICPLNIRL